MKRNVMLLLALGLLVMGSVFAAQFYEKKPYTKWKEKEANKLLTKSPWTYEFNWGRTGNIGRGVQGTTIGDTAGDEDEQIFSGAASEREFITIIRISLFSSRPIRQAFIVSATKGDKDKMERFADFATRAIDDEIILSWRVDSKPKGVSSVLEVNAQLNALTVGELENFTWLTTDTGKKVFLTNYIRPTNDGTGAKFIFPRVMEDGTPFITDDVKTIRFQTKKFKISDDMVAVDATFKIKDMILKDVIEY